MHLWMQQEARFQQLTCMGFGHIYKVAVAVGLCGFLLGLFGCSEPYDSALLRAQQLSQQGKFEPAAALYEKTLPRVPADAKRERAAALVQMGDCYAALGKLREAFVSYQKAAETDGQNLEAHLRLAQFLANADQQQAAGEHAMFVLRRQPDNALALGIAGGMEAAAGNDERAKQLLQRSLAIDPQRPLVAISLAQVYVQEDKFAEARKVLTDTAVATQDTRQAAFAWLALGRMEEQLGDKNNAESAYRAAVKADDSVIPNFRLAQFLERSAKIAEAEQVLSHVDAMRPTEPSALAEARLNAGRAEDAMSVLRVNSPRAAARLIEGRLDEGMSADALNQYRAAFDSTSVAVLEAELALERGDISKAEAAANLALQRSPESPTAHYVRGLVFEQQNKIAEAKENWNSALQSNPEYVPAEIALARQNLKEGDLKTAEQHISSVVRDEPANLEALCIFARVLLKQGKVEPAMSIARRAETVNPKSLEPRLVMGEIGLQEKKYGAAFLEYEHALLIEPDSADALTGVLEVYRHGQVTAAILEKMERVAMSPPASASLLEIAGRLYAAKKMYPQAERALKRSLQTDPTRETAAVALAETRYASGDRDPEHFLSELTLTSKQPFQLGRTIRTLEAADAERRGDINMAVRSYEMAVGAGENSGIAANNLAWAYAQQGIKLDSALRLAASAVDRDPKNPAALDTLGVVQLKRRSYTEAIASLNKAISLMSGHEWRRQSAEVYRHLAEACDGAGLEGRAADARAQAERIEKEYSR